MKRAAVAGGIAVILGAALVAVTLAAAGDYGAAVIVQVAGLLIAGAILALFRLME